MKILRPTVLAGSLDDDLECVATSIVRVCRARPVVVWIDHEDAVFVDAPHRALHAPPDWVVGQYDFRADFDEVCNDLLMFQTARRSSVHDSERALC